MSSNILIPRIALFSEIEEPLDYKVFVYGTKNSLMIDADCPLPGKIDTKKHTKVE